MRRRQLNTWVQVNLRIQEAQRRRLEAAAKANRVSFNEEVRNRLSESLQRESLESFIYKLGMIDVAQRGEPAGTILGDAIKEMLEAKSQSQQEQEKGGKA